MGRLIAYGVALVGVAMLVAGAADICTRTATCVVCHTQEAAFAGWMADRLSADKKGFSHELISCSACHIEGAAERTVASGFRGLLHTATYLVPQIDPRQPLVASMFKTTYVPRDGCQYCHLGSLKRKTVLMKDLPERLTKIGLAMDHRKHVLAREDTCAKCHERYKDEEQRVADKEVNYAEVDHLSCTSCHASASHAYRKEQAVPVGKKEVKEEWEGVWRELSHNPRWMVAIPTERSCRRCHNGKIHYKTRIFLADCSNGKNYDECAKCHPLMTREFFDEHRRKRNKLTSDSAKIMGGG